METYSTEEDNEQFSFITHVDVELAQKNDVNALLPAIFIIC